MIRKVEMYQCVCDRCGKVNSEDGGDIDSYIDENTAREASETNEWLETLDGKHYCPDCFEYNDKIDGYVPKMDFKNK